MKQVEKIPNPLDAQVDALVMAIPTNEIYTENKKDFIANIKQSCATRGIKFCLGFDHDDFTQADNYLLKGTKNVVVFMAGHRLDVANVFYQLSNIVPKDAQVVCAINSCMIFDKILSNIQNAPGNENKIIISSDSYNIGTISTDAFHIIKSMSNFLSNSNSKATLKNFTGAIVQKGKNMWNHPEIITKIGQNGLVQVTKLSKVSESVVDSELAKKLLSTKELSIEERKVLENVVKTNTEIGFGVERFFELFGQRGNVFEILHSSIRAHKEDMLAPIFKDTLFEQVLKSKRYNQLYQTLKNIKLQEFIEHFNPLDATVDQNNIQKDKITALNKLDIEFYQSVFGKKRTDVFIENYSKYGQNALLVAFTDEALKAIRSNTVSDGTYQELIRILSLLPPNKELASQVMKDLTAKLNTNPKILMSVLNDILNIHKSSSEEAQNSFAVEVVKALYSNQINDQTYEQLTRTLLSLPLNQELARQITENLILSLKDNLDKLLPLLDDIVNIHKSFSKEERESFAAEAVKALYSHQIEDQIYTKLIQTLSSLSLNINLASQVMKHLTAKLNTNPKIPMSIVYDILNIHQRSSKEAQQSFTVGVVQALCSNQINDDTYQGLIRTLSLLPLNINLASQVMQNLTVTLNVNLKRLAPVLNYIPNIQGSSSKEAQESFALEILKVVGEKQLDKQCRKDLFMLFNDLHTIPATNPEISKAFISILTNPTEGVDVVSELLMRYDSGSLEKFSPEFAELFLEKVIEKGLDYFTSQPVAFNALLTQKSCTKVFDLMLQGLQQNNQNQGAIDTKLFSSGELVPVFTKLVSMLDTNKKDQNNTINDCLLRICSQEFKNAKEVSFIFAEIISSNIIELDTKIKLFDNLVSKNQANMDLAITNVLDHINLDDPNITKTALINLSSIKDKVTDNAICQNIEKSINKLNAIIELKQNIDLSTMIKQVEDKKDIIVNLPNTTIQQKGELKNLQH